MHLLLALVCCVAQLATPGPATPGGVAAEPPTAAAISDPAAISSSETAPGPEIAAPAPMQAKARDGNTVEVKPLDDTLNPYAGRYDDWDRWVFAHYDATADPVIFRGG